MVSRGQAGAEGWRWARTGWLVMRPTFSSMVAGPLAATARLWPMSDFVAASADIRGDYRYKLTRVWDAALSTLTFVLLNPSTADAVQVDPTLRRCMAFARREGYGGLDVVNLYAFRTKDPKVLMAAADPVGPDNDAVLAAVTGTVVAGWGTNANARRIAQAVSLLPPLHALGVTKGGHPKHPLYVHGDAPMVAWTP
jgi:hypothetical protein